MTIWNQPDTNMGRVNCDWNKDVQDFKPNLRDPNPVVGHCHQCGLELRCVMMYSCRREGCPCFHQATL